MKQNNCVIAPWMLTGLLLTSCLNGCAVRQSGWSYGSRDRAFIDYWPASPDSKQLRLAVKDNIDMKGVVTSAGSEYVVKNNPPAARDADCLAIARQRNVRIVGKTNLSEFAVAPSGLKDFFGTPKNALSKRRKLIPGGSSSGSAVAIANGSADVAFGTDTAGSIRVPAACCGVVGLKTTFGLISTKGVFPIEPRHLDTVGTIGKDVARVVQGMDLLQNGFATRYQATVAANSSARKIRIGRPKKDGNTVAAAGAWISDREYRSKTGVRLRTMAAIVLGRVLYPAQYRGALHRRAYWQHTLRQVFKKVDFIALPTLQDLPPTIPSIGKIALLEARVLVMQNTVPVNFAGNPALAIPIAIQDKTVPVTSLQLVGPRLSEAALLNAGRLIEAGRTQLDRQISTRQPRARNEGGPLPGGFQVAGAEMRP